MELPPFKKPTEVRSRNMRAIRSLGNETTERRLVSLLKEQGVRGWRLHPPRIVGKPDLVIQRQRVAVFVDGCFWHGCPNCGHVPKTNAAYWRAKILRNRRRDSAVSRKLKSLGYSVIRIWECQLRTRSERCVRRISRAVEHSRPGHVSVRIKFPKIAE